MGVLSILLATLAVGAPPVTSHGSQYGRVLFDSRGFALYAFTADTPRRSACSGACATSWPPYVVASRPRGARLGAIRRADGKLQLTYAGRPLYHYVGDKSAGQILCQDVEEFGGRWLVLRPNGRLVR